MLEAVWKDIHHTLRLLRRSPIFTTVTVLSLAIGIGANTAIFSAVNALLLRPRSGVNERGLVDVGRTVRGSDFDNSSYPNYLDLRRATPDVLVDLAAYRLEPKPLSFASGKQSAERIFGQTVTANYFDLLGVRPLLGRLFRPEDDTPGAGLSAVASYRFWRERLDGDRGAVGGSITLNGQTFTLVGVTPERFYGTSVLAPDIWLPIGAPTSPPILQKRNGVWLMMIGRLKPDVSLEQAQAALSTISKNLEEAYPDSNEAQAYAMLASGTLPGQIGFYVGAFLALLMSIVGLVLLIAIVNLAGMFLARAVARDREIAIKLAIGAGRGRLIGQLVTESLLLCLLGGAAGFVLALWLRSLLLAFLPQLPVPVAIELPLDGRVLAFTAAISVAAGLLAGLAPALKTSKPDVLSALKGAGLSTPPPSRLRNLMLVTQIAFSLVLLVTAGLLIRALDEAGRIDPGFDAARVDTVQLDLSLAGYDESRGLVFADRLLARVRAVPGIESACLAVDLPLDGGGYGFGRLIAPGVDRPDEEGVGADWNLVTSDFFRTMGTTLVEGRAFTESDRAEARRVAIVNQTLANQLWPGESAIGKRLLNPQPEGTIELEVVGVEKDLKYRTLGEAPRRFIYVPYPQRYFERVHLLVRRAPGANVLPAVRALVTELDPNLPVVNMSSLTEYTSIGLLPQRVALTVAGSLGLVGLALVVLGIYGVVAYSVRRRARELGVRIAMGAEPREVLYLILRHGARLGGLGAMFGAVLALATTRAFAGLLYGIAAADPLTYGAAGALLIGAVIAASLPPARRAASIDPVAVLREE